MNALQALEQRQPIDRKEQVRMLLLLSTKGRITRRIFPEITKVERWKKEETGDQIINNLATDNTT